MGKAIRESSCGKTDGKKFQIGNACSLTERKDYSCLCTRTISKWQERNEMWIQCGKYSQEPTSFLDHVYLGCTQRECKTNKDFLDNYRDLFESRMPASGLENCFIQKNSKQRFHLGLLIWKVCEEKRGEIVNLQTNQFNNYTKSQLHVLTTINSKKKRWDLLGNCQKYAPKLF